MKKSGTNGRVYVDKQKGEWIDVGLEALRKAKLKIPVITSNPKREETTLVRFTSLLRLARMAEETHDSMRKKRNEYKTISDVYRAAFYIGMEMLYWYEKSKFPEQFEAWGSPYANSIRRLEEWMVDMQKYDHLVKLMGTALDIFKKGHCSQKEFHSEIMETINDAPERFQASLKDAYKKVVAGESVSSLQMCSYQGGDHMSEKYKKSQGSDFT